MASIPETDESVNVECQYCGGSGDLDSLGRCPMCRDTAAERAAMALEMEWEDRLSGGGGEPW